MGLPADGRALGLPAAVTTCLFDLDGVLTDTAAVHNKAWAEIFDAFLRARGGPFQPFDQAADYETYVDGKARLDGVRSFLASRGITLPDGHPDDAPGEQTVNGLGNKKNEVFLRRVRQDGVVVFQDAIRYLHAARDAGLRRIVVSASANSRQILEVTGLAALVEGWIDGTAISERGLRGKPAPDTYLAGAQCAGVDAQHAAVFEDALSGVEAGRAGNFGAVVGVNRIGQEHGEALRAHGADVVVHNLEELLEVR